VITTIILTDQNCWLRRDKEFSDPDLISWTSAAIEVPQTICLAHTTLEDKLENQHCSPLHNLQLWSTLDKEIQTLSSNVESKINTVALKNSKWNGRTDDCRKLLKASLSNRDHSDQCRTRSRFRSHSYFHEAIAMHPMEFSDITENSDPARRYKQPCSWQQQAGNAMAHR